MKPSLTYSCCAGELLRQGAPHTHLSLIEEHLPLPLEGLMECSQCDRRMALHLVSHHVSSQFRPSCKSYGSAAASSMPCSFQKQLAEHSHDCSVALLLQGSLISFS